MSSQGETRFRKVLYLREQQVLYPDNYVDETFLNDLQRNGALLSSLAQSSSRLVSVSRRGQRGREMGAGQLRQT